VDARVRAIAWRRAAQGCDRLAQHRHRGRAHARRRQRHRDMERAVDRVEPGRAARGDVRALARRTRNHRRQRRATESPHGGRIARRIRRRRRAREQRTQDARGARLRVCRHLPVVAVLVGGLDLVSTASGWRSADHNGGAADADRRRGADLAGTLPRRSAELELGAAQHAGARLSRRVRIVHRLRRLRLAGTRGAAGDPRHLCVRESRGRGRPRLVVPRRAAESDAGARHHHHHRRRRHRHGRVAPAGGALSRLGALLLCAPIAAGAATLRIGNGAEPETLDPQRMQTPHAINIAHDLYEGLTSVAPDGEIVGGAASDWDVGDGGKVYTFHLRPKLRWSNGDALTADDFVAGLRRGVDPATGRVYAAVLAPIVNADAILSGGAAPDKLGVDAPDARTLRIRLKGPTPYLPGLLT